MSKNDDSKITFKGSNYSHDGTDVNFTFPHTSEWDIFNGTTFTIKDPTEEKVKDLERKIDKIMERLSVLDDPDPETLRKQKMLKDAYNKYKMIEKLIGEKNGK